jgi:hypothetical protein
LQALWSEYRRPVVELDGDSVGTLVVDLMIVRGTDLAAGRGRLDLPLLLRLQQSRGDELARQTVHQ